MSVQYNLGCESASEYSDEGSYWSDDDEDRFCGDAEWEVSEAAKVWEARRLLSAEAKIKQDLEEASLQDIRFLFDEEEECVTCKPNWDWEYYTSDNDYYTDSDSNSDSDSGLDPIAPVSSLEKVIRDDIKELLTCRMSDLESEDEEDDDEELCFSGDPEWMFSSAAKMWDARRELYVASKVAEHH